MTDRLHRHNNGKVSYTSSRLPVELMIAVTFKDKDKAYGFEKYLKSGSGKAFMNKRFLNMNFSIFIQPVFELVPAYIPFHEHLLFPVQHHYDNQ